MTILILLIFLGCGNAQTAQSNNSTPSPFKTILPNDQNITYIGRWGDLTINSSPVKVAISGGLRMRVQFTGKGLSLHCDRPDSETNSEISWSIDGGPWSRQAITASTMKLANGLPSGKHTLDLWVEATPYDNLRWTSLKGVRITGITLDADGTLSSWPLSAAGKMLIIGDSIAEGMLITGPSNSLEYSSGRFSFGALLAETLNMEVWIHAFGGSGFYGTFPPSAVPETNENYSFKMSGMPLTDPQFDIVLIEAGNNDGTADIRKKYAELISKIRILNPNAKIYCMGLIYPAPADQFYIQMAANEANATYISTASWVFTHPNQKHPDLAGHATIANYLKSILRPTSSANPE